nr:hypothetical protein [Cyanidiaceae sp.]
MIILNIQYNLNSHITYIQDKFLRRTHVAINNNGENRNNSNFCCLNTRCSKKIVIKSFINKYLIKKVYKNSGVKHLQNKAYDINQKKFKLLLKKIGQLGYFAQISISKYYGPEQEIIKIKLSPNDMLKTIKTQKKSFVSLIKISN